MKSGHGLIESNPFQHSSRGYDVLLRVYPQWVFSGTAFIFGVLQLWSHIRREELSWYQIEHNYGEIFFAFSASVILPVLQIEYATALLLAMAISDGVTEIIRHSYFRRHGFNVKLRKHWTGSIGYFVTALLIALPLLEAGTAGKIGGNDSNAC